MTRLKITTFNTELLETPTADRETHYQMEDDERAALIGQLLVASGADIVVLNEVFATSDKKALRKALAPTHPHYVLEVGDGDAFEQDSGLMLFSRFPFLPLANQTFRPGALYATSNGADTSEVAFVEFDHGFDLGAALGMSLFVSNTISDALADKGVAVVILDTPLGPLPVAFSHLWASYGDDSVCQTLQKFDMRRQQLALAVALLHAVVPPEQLPSAVFLGDLNVIGNHHVDPIRAMPYGTRELVAMCGTTPGGLARGEITDERQFEARLPPATVALLPIKPGLLGLLFKVAQLVAAGEPLGCMQYPGGWDSIALRRSGAEWERNILGGPIGASFDDGWSRLYGGIADPGDLGTTNGDERLDYVLVPKDGSKSPYAPRWTVHHMTRAYNLLRGDSGIRTDWGTIGTTALSDHLGVNAYLAPRSEHCSPNQARNITALPFDRSFAVEDEDAFSWLRVDLEGTVKINPRGGRMDVYHSSQMSIPVRARSGDDPEVVDYKLPNGTYFLRLMAPPGSSSGSIEVRKPDGATRGDALHLDPCEPLEVSMSPGIPHGNADEVWFKVQTEPGDGDRPQRLGFAIGPSGADPSFARRYAVEILAPDGTPVAKVGRTAGGAFEAQLKHDARAYPTLFVVVRRLDLQASGFVISWTTDLIVLGSMQLRCLETTPGAGDDEILIRIAADGRVVTRGNDGWADAGTFEAGTNPAGLDGSNVLAGSACVRGHAIELRMLEDDTGDVFGPDPEIFEVVLVEGSAFDPALRSKATTIDLRYRNGGHYQLTGWFGRRSFDLPIQGSQV